MKYEINETYQFNGTSYTLTENHILSDDDKMPFLYKMNGVAILFIIVGVALTLALFWGRMDWDYSVWYITLLLFLFIPYVVIHELLHGITFVLGSGNAWSTMKFGLILRQGLAYCISLVPVSIRRARLSLMMPVYVICLPVYVIGVITGDVALAIFGVLLTSGSVGDFYYLWKLRKVDPSLFMYEAPPTKTGYEIGFLLFEQL